MVDALSCPVTAKIRLLEDSDDAIEYAKKLESTGISMLTGNTAPSAFLRSGASGLLLIDLASCAAVHGRTARQKKQFVGQANWDVIRRIKSVLSIPVVANGGVSAFQDVQRFAMGACTDRSSTQHVSVFPADALKRQVSTE